MEARASLVGMTWIGSMVVAAATAGVSVLVAAKLKVFNRACC